MPAMANTEELADLRAHVRKLERRLAESAGETERTQQLLVARVLVVVATVALFLAMSISWYDAVEVGDETVDSVSGWRAFTFLAGDKGVLAFGGFYSWVVVLAALAAGTAVLRLRRRAVAITLSTLLGLLAAGHLLLNLIAKDVEQLAGAWCAVFVMAAAAFAWGNLVRPLREEETAALYSSRA